MTCMHPSQKGCGSAQHEEMPASRYVPLDPPMFSAEQRRQAAANMEERIRAESAPAAALRTSCDRHEEHEEGPAPPSGDVVEMITAEPAGSSSRPSRDPDIPNRRERPQGRQKPDASAPTAPVHLPRKGKSKRRQRKTSTKCKSQRSRSI